MPLFCYNPVGIYSYKSEIKRINLSTDLNEILHTNIQYNANPL